ncbi:esterase [Glaciecola sp. MH2013]|uniref:YqiA/YcfP family alpha/beta fold hydrolase n=1 Tax=Glaciecola sp. MH2013 TaxID=2785524 RepID=UPI00189F5CD6|nr:YqiA/YcfP family alpha/beta fold hydrolase [Glaciecola sp. MH2013]MBF7071883.1 esterase [Glaciecola sp. MH2013]
MNHLIYLHGFLSSPASQKAQQAKRFFSSQHPDITVHIPTLLGDPDSAVTTVSALFQSIHTLESENKSVNQDTPHIAFIGSSMGGFLSTYFAEKFNCKAALINPAVRPFDLMASYLGSHINPYTGEEFEITPATIQSLRNLDTPISRDLERYMVFLQTGDETLDYKLAVEKYGSSLCNIEQGGDHSYVGFENKLPQIARFLFPRS